MTSAFPREYHRVTSREANEFLQKTVEKWEPVSEIWHFRFGGNIGGVMSCFSGAYITYYIRRTLKLREYGRLTCYLPVAGMGCFLGETLHDTVINSRLMSMGSCSTCTIIEAALLQSTVGIVYPLILSPIVGFYMSDKLLTYPVPSLRQAPKELFQLWWKIVRMNPRPLIASGILQGLVMAYITHQKQNFLFNFVENS